MLFRKRIRILGRSCTVSWRTTYVTFMVPKVVPQSKSRNPALVQVLGLAKGVFSHESGQHPWFPPCLVELNSQFIWQTLARGQPSEAVTNRRALPYILTLPGTIFDGTLSLLADLTSGSKIITRRLTTFGPFDELWGGIGHPSWFTVTGEVACQRSVPSRIERKPHLGTFPGSSHRMSQQAISSKGKTQSTMETLNIFSTTS